VAKCEYRNNILYLTIAAGRGRKASPELESGQPVMKIQIIFFHIILYALNIKLEVNDQYGILAEQPQYKNCS
jgi:hypothetical protein